MVTYNKHGQNGGHNTTLCSAFLHLLTPALFTYVILVAPGAAHRISPILNAIAGFAGGFFIPLGYMPLM